MYDVFTAHHLPLTVILRWAGVFLPGGQTQMPLIIRDDLDEDNEGIEDGLFEEDPF